MFLITLSAASFTEWTHIHYTHTIYTKHMGQTILTVKSFKLGIFFLNLCPPLLTCCGNLVGSGRFIAHHHAHLSQEEQLAHPKCCSCAGCEGNKILIDFLFFKDLYSSSRIEYSPRGLFGPCPLFWQCKWDRVWHYADKMHSVGSTMCIVKHAILSITFSLYIDSQKPGSCWWFKTYFISFKISLFSAQCTLNIVR